MTLPHVTKFLPVHPMPVCSIPQYNTLNISFHKYSPLSYWDMVVMSFEYFDMFGYETEAAFPCSDCDDVWPCLLAWSQLGGDRMKVTSFRWGFCTISRQVKFVLSNGKKVIFLARRIYGNLQVYIYKMLRLVQSKCLHPRSQGLLFPCKGPDFDVENLSVYISNLVYNSTALIIWSNYIWYIWNIWLDIPAEHALRL